MAKMVMHISRASQNRPPPEPESRSAANTSGVPDAHSPGPGNVYPTAAASLARPWGRTGSMSSRPDHQSSTGSWLSMCGGDISTMHGYAGTMRAHLLRLAVTTGSAGRKIVLEPRGREEGNRRVPHRPPPAPRARSDRAGTPGRGVVGADRLCGRPVFADRGSGAAIDGANGTVGNIAVLNADGADRAGEVPGGFQCQAAAVDLERRPESRHAQQRQHIGRRVGGITGDPAVPGRTLADFATDQGTEVTVTGFTAGPVLREVDPGDVRLRQCRGPVAEHSDPGSGAALHRPTDH